MKPLLRFSLLFVLPALFIFYMVSCNLKKSSLVALDVAAKPFEKLSDYNFFAGVMNELKANMQSMIPHRCCNYRWVPA